MNAGKNVRPSPIAGRWYPGDEKELARKVDTYIAGAKLPEIEGSIIAIMSPHAGYLYSGPVAGYAFAAVKGYKPDLVVVVSPMHHPYTYPLLTTLHDAFVTPLGEIPVDTGAVKTLSEQLERVYGTHLTAVAQDPEHSLEIELPFLQRALDGGFHLLPVMVRDQSIPVMEALGTALAEVLKGKNTLLVASTDLSHFYPQKIALKYDYEFLRRVETFDPQSVINAEEEGVGFACGRGAVAAVMWASKILGANKIQILNHATSGDIIGKYDEVVGYGAAVMTRT